MKTYKSGLTNRAKLLAGKLVTAEDLSKVTLVVAEKLTKGQLFINPEASACPIGSAVSTVEGLMDLGGSRLCIHHGHWDLHDDDTGTDRAANFSGNIHVQKKALIMTFTRD